MTRQPIRIFRALSLVALLVCPVATSPAASHRRKQAESAYDRALDLKASFESQPEDSRSRQDCEKVARAFHEVYRLDPTYTKAPVSLQIIAQLYEEMGRALRSDRYYRASVEAYRFLIAQYPYHPFSRDALLRVGEIYDTELRNPDAAQKAYQIFLEQYPRVKGSARARERLRQLARNEGEKESTDSGRVSSEASRAGESRTLGRDRHETTSAPARESQNQAQDKAIEPAPREPRDRAKNPPQLSTVRHWVGPNYSRVVIGVDDEVKFETIRLTNPDRIVLDLMNTHLARGMNGKTLAAEDGYLRQIRVAQFKPDVTRVVLDVQKVEGYSVFALPNPFRLVIDIQGTKPEAASKAQPEASAETPSHANSSEAPSPSTSTPSRAATSTSSSGEVALESNPASEGTRREARREESIAKTSSQQHAVPTATVPVVPKRRDNEVPVKPAAPMESGSRTLTRALGLKVAKIVIDPGHGGHDTGTVGPGGLCEKDLVLDVGWRVKKLIERDLGSTVIMTRNDDTFIPLEERTAIANQNAADLFISIHANASRDKDARGIETYYLNFTSNAEALEVAARENATSQESVHQLQDLIKKIVLTEKIEESHEFANELQREVLTRLAKDNAKQKNRGVKRAPFVVLIGANMPSILTEISFLTNPRDERLLKRSEYRQKIAVALYQGLLKYMNTLGGLKVAQKAREPHPQFPAREPSSSPDQPNF